MKNDFSSPIAISDSASFDLRRRIGLGDRDAIRVAYIPGPGDVYGTFQHWREKRHEPRVPIIAYSLMFYELMEKLQADCKVISINSLGSEKHISDGNFSFEQVSQRKFRGRWSYFWSQYLFSKDIVSIVNRYDPHIVVTSTHSPTLSWKKLSNGRKLVLTAHNTFWPKGLPPRSLKGQTRKALLEMQAKAIDAAICTSGECAQQISELTGGRVQGEVACPQIVDKYPIERRTTMRNLMFLGRLEAAKGIFMLLDAFEQIAEDHRDLTLSFVGDGTAENDLKARVATSPFSNRIKLLGRVNSVGVHEAISASDLVICPTMTTFNEGLAVVGFEAAAHGIPTLISSVVPAAELLGESCTIFNADDSLALGESLTCLIERPDLYRNQCSATAAVRDLIYNRSMSWGSGLFRAMIN